MYELATGPLAWISFGIFVVGMVVRGVLLYVITRRSDPVVFDHLSLKWSLLSIGRWLLPFGSRGMRQKPVFTAAAFVFHICLLATPIFLLAHNVLWDERWGLRWWTLPEQVTDAMTLLLFVSALVLVLRRVFSPEARIVTTAYDYFLLAIVLAPFVTGFLAYHQWLNYKAVLNAHIVFSEILLVTIPFTKLGHFFLFFLTRAHMGSEFGRRGARTW